MKYKVSTLHTVILNACRASAIYMNEDCRKRILYKLKSPNTQNPQGTVPHPAPVVVVLPSGRPGRKSRRKAWADRHTRPSGEETGIQLLQLTTKPNT